MYGLFWLSFLFLFICFFIFKEIVLFIVNLILLFVVILFEIRIFLLFLGNFLEIKVIGKVLKVFLLNLVIKRYGLFGFLLFLSVV